ncbi:MAG: N-acetylmuramoyl-L-alanine amidase [Bacteroidales bacterium]|nr:N-acetylmuramoyl-L-alanine amidase [Bacteroidales bacterium]
MKRLGLIFGISLALISLYSQALGQGDNDKFVVVLDAGHGGKDPGAVGKHTYEKDIVLSIVLKTGEYINKYCDDVEVIYTRKTDRFVELYKRAEIANKNHADLFVSVHCNANESSRFYGSETYVMGLHKTQENLEVAKQENAAILLEDDYKQTYNGFDPNEPENHIIFSMYQNAYLDRSLEMASEVQDQFRERVSRRDRGVKQAGFLVLYRVTMPGVLVETGFLTNRKEERFLASESGQVYMASAIYRAFKDYKQSIEKENRKSAKIAGRGDNHSGPHGNGKETFNQHKPNSVEDGAGGDNDLVFRVQFASSENPKGAGDPAFNRMGNVFEYHHKGLYKYTVGSTSDLDKAVNLKHQVEKMGYNGAFVVAFLNGERISMKKARNLLEK